MPTTTSPLLSGRSCSFFSFFISFSFLGLLVWVSSLFFQPLERKPKKFNPLVIPKSLQAALPFASKRKDIPSRGRPLPENRRAVVMEPHERKVHALVQHLRLIRNEKIKKRKLKDDKKRKEIEVQKAKEEQLSKKCQREERRERYREQDKLKKKIRRNAED
ncbi:unnamed protein product [Prunus brigantina]